jgi:type II secretory pathway pseudopilin PulG
MADRCLRRLLREERAMTVVEMLVAAALMAIGLIALLTTFDGSRDLVNASERNGIAAHRGELEIEKALSLGYKNIALTSSPAHSGSQSSPDWYANSDGTYQWDQSPSPQPADPMVVDATDGALVHVSTWNDGQSRLSGSIYRYVTWIDDPNIAGTHDAKRITIAVTVDQAAPHGFRKPVLVSSIAIDPKAG